MGKEVTDVLGPALEDSWVALDHVSSYQVLHALRSAQGAQSRFCWEGPQITEVNTLILQMRRLEPKEAK